MAMRLAALCVLGCCFTLKAASQAGFRLLAPGAPVIKNRAVLPQNFYTRHLPFSCKKESQLQKATGLNLALRLGSKDYVDWLERKPNANRRR